ncbi:transporter substrate-binding domain-containing protein [Oxalobacteraceae bacterium]|nr:transporter substrate-binding domain-containing protein [Oxalobacteraceae bacterium]
MLNRLLLCWATLLALGATAAPLRVGGFPVAPIVTVGNDGTAQGALREFMEREIVHKAGVPLIWSEITSYGRAVESLRTGQIDILLVTSTRGLEKNPYPMFAWTYLRVHPQLAVARSSPLQSVTSLQQLSGLEIGWAGGAVVIDGLDQIDIKWRMLASPDWQLMNLRKVMAGRIQGAYFENEFSPQYIVQKEKLDIVLLRLPLAERFFTMGYSPRSDPADIARFDRAAAAAFAGEQFRAFLDEYMKR